MLNGCVIADMHEDKLKRVAGDDSWAHGCQVSPIPKDSSEQGNGSES